MGELREYATRASGPRPAARQLERYGELTRVGEWSRVSKLARDVKRARKSAIKAKIIADFIDNPRGIRLIAEKFNVSESMANYAINKYTHAQYVPKINQ